jgi:hypothetical protein
MDKVKNKPFYSLKGTAMDIETIVRLRRWMEDEVRETHGQFSETKLLTQYDAKSNIFSFAIEFFK